MHDDRLFLSLPIESRIGLLVLLEAPGQAVPHNDMASCLQIESVGRTCWMRQQDLDAPRIPVPHLFGAMQDPRLGKSLLQHIEVMLVGIEYEDGLPRIRLDDVRQGVKLGMAICSRLLLRAAALIAVISASCISSIKSRCIRS